MPSSKILASALALIFSLLCAWATAAPLASGKGQFTFTDDAGHTGKTIPVWYYKPDALPPDARVFIVMHGAERNGEQYRDHWIRHAEKHKFLLIVPEFSRQDFPSGAYQFGNIQARNKQAWTFWIIEHLFDSVRQRESLRRETYYLYGHSAGAQFTHRFMLFMPSPRVEIAFSANAGSYTMPVYASASEPHSPMNLDRQDVDEKQLGAAFSRRMVVMLGERDINENGKNVPNSEQAKAQGKNRFERGQKFFRLAQEQAAKQKSAFQWERITVLDVGHSDSGMSRAVMRYLFPE